MTLILFNVGSLFIILAIFLLIFVFDYQRTKQELKNLKLITLTAFLVSLSVVLNLLSKGIFLSLVPSKILELKLGNFVLVMIGFLCGGMFGLIGGIASDLLGVLIFSTGTANIFFTLTSVLWCITPYYLVLSLENIYHKKWTTYIYLVLSYALVLAFVSGTNPLILVYMYNYDQDKGWWILYLPRLIKYPLDVFFNSILLVTCYRTFYQKTIIYERLLIKFRFQKPEVNPFKNPTITEKGES